MSQSRYRKLIRRQQRLLPCVIFHFDPVSRALRVFPWCVIVVNIDLSAKPMCGLQACDTDWGTGDPIGLPELSCHARFQSAVLSLCNRQRRLYRIGCVSGSTRALYGGIRCWLCFGALRLYQ